MPSVGMNLVGVKYWVGQAPFLDRFKTSGNWVVYNTDGSSGDAQVNADGYPTALAANAKHVMTQIGLDPVAASAPDIYVLTYEGAANLDLSGARILSREAGKITFEFTSTTSNSVGLKLSNISAADPVHNVHVVRQDQVSLFASGAMFNPEFVAKASQWSVLRFMDWENTNRLSPVTWENRTTESSATWSNKSNSGVPLEVMVRLANEAHTDMWFNVPTMADDTYVRNALTYIRENLSTDLKVHLEYSNEMWNWNFDQSDYARDRANALWGTDANGDGIINPDDVAENAAYGWLEYYGYRSAQVAAIGNEVFGADTRLQAVLATQTVSRTADEHIFDGIARANAGAVYDLFDEYAVTTYFGASLDSDNADDRAIVLDWARSGAAGLDAAFEELEVGGFLSSDRSVLALADTLAYQYSVAQNQGLKLIAYEGGAHLTSNSYSNADQATVVDFIGRLMNDPRMGALYAHMSDVFSEMGGSSLVAFDDVGTNSKSGYWGVLDDIYQTSSPRYDALLAARTAEVVLPPNAFGNVVTSATTFQLSAIAKNLTYSGIKTFTGTGNDLDNIIVGGLGVNYLYGLAGKDTLTGGGMNDFIDGGTGADRMVGGAGNDIYIVDDAGDTVIESITGGTDEIRTALVKYRLGANVEKLTYTGSANFSGKGNALDNTITGGFGNDSLDGMEGADRMAGSFGNDNYFVDNALDVVSEAMGAGFDTVNTTLGEYTLRVYVEALRFKGSGNFVGTGNTENNSIYGGAGDDTLSGLAGNDTLNGDLGNDKLSGGAGNDVMNGGDGNDSLNGGEGIDRMTGGNGDDSYSVDNIRDVVTELAGGGVDTVTSTVDCTLSDNVENLVLSGTAINGNGNGGDNNILGNTLDNVLNGGAGNDTLNGGKGNDIIIGGPGKDMLTGGVGVDVFRFLNNDLAATAANSSTILDFSRTQGDKIDLSLMDANTLTATRDRFRFIDGGSFSHSAGELRSEWNAGGYWEVQGDLDGNGVADIVLSVVGKSTAPLLASDFTLGA